jgi:hypothetical protein
MKLSVLKNRLSLLLLIPAFLLALTACETNQELITEIAEEELEMAALDADISANFEEVENFSVEAMEITDQTVNGRDYSDPAAKTIPACATVSHDSVAKTITIDFGTGCVGADGKTRAGQIVLTYTKRLYWPGASLTITPVNYSVEGVLVEGTKTITNVSPNFQSNISLNVTLIGGKLTFANGDTATRAFTKTRTWVRAANPIMDEYHVEGMAQGTNRLGESYSCKVVSTLIWKRKCRRQGIRVPAQGLKLIKKDGRPDLLIDFGDGECDTLVTLTANGKSKVVDLANL